MNWIFVVILEGENKLKQNSMMKTIFNLVLIAVCVTFFSCQKDDVSTGNSSITSDGVISGKIVNYVANSLDSVKARNTNYVGSGLVLSTGEFTIHLTIPELSKIGSLSGVAISDTTVMGGAVAIRAYLNNSIQGDLQRCNYANDSLNKAGLSYSSFIYTDKPLTLKGTHIETYTGGGYTENSTNFYDVTFKKGWNEVVFKITAYSSTTNSLTESVSMTNIIPSDLQWHFIKLYYSVRGELPVREKTAKIFR